jgi:hypothetical protein
MQEVTNPVVAKDDEYFGYPIGTPHLLDELQGLGTECSIAALANLNRRAEKRGCSLHKFLWEEAKSYFAQAEEEAKTTDATTNAYSGRDLQNVPTPVLLDMIATGAWRDEPEPKAFLKNALHILLANADEAGLDLLELMHREGYKLVSTESEDHQVELDQGNRDKAEEIYVEAVLRAYEQGAFTEDYAIDAITHMSGKHIPALMRICARRSAVIDTLSEMI